MASVALTSVASPVFTRFSTSVPPPPAAIESKTRTKSRSSVTLTGTSDGRLTPGNTSVLRPEASIHRFTADALEKSVMKLLVFFARITMLSISYEASWPLRSPANATVAWSPVAVNSAVKLWNGPLAGAWDLRAWNLTAPSTSTANEVGAVPESLPYCA